MPGRIESYIHSDKSTANKGGVLVKVTCQTDFAANTNEFKQFCGQVAKFAYGFLSPESEQDWESLVHAVGWSVDSTTRTLEDMRKELETTLKERVSVERIVRLDLI